MHERGMQGQPLQLEEGWLCLDFANTVSWHASARPQEKLNTYADLVAWARSVRLVEDKAADRLLTEAAQRPEEAQAALHAARALREAIYRVFAAVAAGADPAPADLDTVNEALARGMVYLRVARAGDEFRWWWDVPRGSLTGMLWPVARSAAELLTSDDLSRVGQCADEDGCGWLFFDVSKNHSRRWCGSGCANRAKARRFYARIKQAGEDQ